MLPLLLLFVFSLFCLPALAARPLATEDPGVCGRGVTQLEVGADYSSQAGDRNYAVTTVPIYGLTDSIELSFELPYRVNRPQGGPGSEGLSDSNLVLKTLFITEGATNPAFLVKSVFKLLNGNQAAGLGSGDTDLSLVAVMGKAFGQLVVNANLGYTFVGRKADPALSNYILYGLSGEYTLTAKFKLVGELYGEQDHHYDTGAFVHRTTNPLLGLTYQLGSSAIIDLGLRNQSVTAGLSLTF